MQAITLNQAPALEVDALTARMKGTWLSGDFGKIVMTYAASAAGFITRLTLRRDLAGLW